MDAVQDMDDKTDTDNEIDSSTVDSEIKYTNEVENMNTGNIDPDSP